MFPDMITDSQSAGQPVGSIHTGFPGRIARAFIKSPLTPMMVLFSFFLGVGAVLLIPREEEPQIIVPMIDVIVSMPGTSAHEIEERATRPMEKLLWEIPGVEYIYSTSRPGQSLVILRFKVGEDMEKSLVKLNQKLQSNFDRIPHGVSFPLVKPRSIDEVPMLALTLHSKVQDHYMLRRVAIQLEEELKQIPNIAETTIIGGYPRAVRVILDQGRLNAYNLNITDIVSRLRRSNRQYRSGNIVSNNVEMIIETGGFLSTAQEVASVVVGSFGSKPVYVRDIAEVLDEATEPVDYVFHGYGKASESSGSEDEAAVTISIAKRPGANATALSSLVHQKLAHSRPLFVPADIEITTTRDYGETAAEKSNELLLHMLLAVVGVAILILFFLGYRESLVVSVAIPTTLALTLLVFYLYGYTLNRITLFALIFSIGILVDDAIVVIENIVRCLALPCNRGRSFATVAIEAVAEVGNPTVLATFAVIAAILPMAFVGGMMGPYMRPIPIGATAAMVFSLLIAFSVTPWASALLLRQQGKNNATKNSASEVIETTEAEAQDGPLTRIYRRAMSPLINRVQYRMLFLIVIVLLLLGSLSLFAFEFVKVKMLPFDNKSEFQIVLNAPEGSPLEHTARIAREMAQAIRGEPEIENYQIYVGNSSPYNFNGLVRHYFLRNGPNVADIQVNLIGKDKRSRQSHDIAKRVRSLIQPIAAAYSCRVTVAEVPPGPPVLQTIVAEVYGPEDEGRKQLASKLIEEMKAIPGIVDIDRYIEDEQPRVRLLIDKQKSALHGISAEQISDTVRLALSGASLDLAHVPDEKEDVNIVLELPRSDRVSIDDILKLRLRPSLPVIDTVGSVSIAQQHTGAQDSSGIPLRELVTVYEDRSETSIYHKNLMPVTYVVADVAGEIESPVYALSPLNRALAKLDRSRFGGSVGEIEVYNISQPFVTSEPAVKWDGEWQITLEVFRDLGIAFIVVLILIYVLMVGWFSSFVIPALVMVAIPFSLVGILPAHAAMGAFFTATSMIGFMAGAGIVVRNSIILVDFIEERLRYGDPLEKAVIDAGAIRFRPMLLTALAVVVGASVILFDPIFQGLAISLIAGEIASLLISRMAVPVLYYMFVAKRDQDASLEG